MSDGRYNDGLRAFLADDFDEALAHWRPLAEAGHAMAAWRIGYMLETGQGLPRDPTAAASWYERAAAGGSGEAMAALGAMLLHGSGVPQDFGRAYVWLSLAAALDAPGARVMRDRAIDHLSSEQLAEAEAESRRRFLALPGTSTT